MSQLGWWRPRRAGERRSLNVELAASAGGAWRQVVDAIRSDIREGIGTWNVDMANDLVALSALFLSSWGEIEKRTAATEKEVRRAGELGPLLLAALGVREHGAPVSPGDAADRRVRAFTLFTRAYDAPRRARPPYQGTGIPAGYT